MTNRILHFKNLIVIFFLLVITSCGKSNQFSVEGIITSKERGKDGHTASVTGDDGKFYSAVISRVNMAGTFEYGDLDIGGHVKIYGDTIHLGDEISIKVTKIKIK